MEQPSVTQEGYKKSKGLVSHTKPINFIRDFSCGITIWSKKQHICERPTSVWLFLRAKGAGEQEKESKKFISPPSSF